MLIEESALKKFIEGSLENRIKKIESEIKLCSEIGCTRLVASFDDYVILCNDKGKIFRCEIEWEKSEVFLISFEFLGELKVYSGSLIQGFLEEKARETVEQIHVRNF